MQFLYLAFIAFTFHGAYGYPGGAPSGVCSSMKPVHEEHAAQVITKVPPPYEIVLPFNKTLSPGQVIQIHLATKSAANQVAFKGFLVTARKKTSRPDNTPHGTFTAEVPASKRSPVMFSKPLNCSGLLNSSVTHRNSDDKQRVTLTWRAPMIPREYFFLATFVQNFETFWMDVTSEVITVADSQLGSAGITTTTPATYTVKAKTHMDELYEGCGREFNCFGTPADCEESKSCEILFAWAKINSERPQPGSMIHMKLVGNVKVLDGVDDEFVAVGISKDEIWGNDTIFGCFVDKRNKTMVDEFTTTEKWIPLPLPVDVRGAITHRTHLSAYVPSSGMKQLRCDFEVQEALDPSGHYENSSTSYVNLSSQDVHLLLLRGHHADATGLGEHETKPLRTSGTAFRLASMPTLKQGLISSCSMPVDIQETSENMTKRFAAECGKSSTCIALPDGCLNSEKCKVFARLASLKGGDNCKGFTEIEVFGETSTAADSGYVAVGLSLDNKMGKDAVFGCYLDGDMVRAGEFYNVKKERFQNHKVQRGHHDEVIVKSSTSKSDGRISCRFTVKSFVNLTKEFGMNFDLSTQSLYIFLARGDEASADGLGWHSDKASSTSRTTVKSSRFLAITASNMLAGLHGGLMVIAWVLLVSVGQFTARYYKDTCQDFKLFGKAWWFIVHQTCMFTAVILTLIAIVIIFVEVGGYMEGRASMEEIYHPILGLIVTCLAVIQVFGAFLRPDPNSEYRYIFNWAHWFIGTSCHWIAIACICLANGLGKMKLSETKSYWNTILAFIILHLFLHGMISLYTFAKDNPHLNFRGVFAGPQTAKRNDKHGTRTRIVILALELLVAAACSIALILYIGAAT